jgi:hypothetical protein
MVSAPEGVDRGFVNLPINDLKRLTFCAACDFRLLTWRPDAAKVPAATNDGHGLWCILNEFLTVIYESHWSYPSNWASRQQI